jgi:hypothetical protein
MSARQKSMAVLEQKPDHAQHAGVYEELILIDRLHHLPEDALRRVLRTIAPSLLKAAVEEFDSPAVVGQISPAYRTASKEQQIENRRSEPRQKVFRTASALFNDDFNVIHVQVRDLSERGCRIRVTSTAHLPNSFNLLIEGSLTTRLCEVRWRSSLELGVLFTPK